MATLVQRADGLLLRVVAELIGARVTSWTRSPERNKAVGGVPNSYHVWGGAVDVGKETTDGQRAVLRRFAREVDETGKAGGPHWHYQVDGRSKTVVGPVLALLAVWWAYTNQSGGE